MTHALEIGRLLCSTLLQSCDTSQPFVGYHPSIHRWLSPKNQYLQDILLCSHLHADDYRSIRLPAGGWLSSEAAELFLRDLAILMRWLRGQSGPKITFNCSGEVLMKAVELKILRPEARDDVC